MHFHFSTLVISAYLVRHYVFTLTVLKRSKTKMVVANGSSDVFEPTVTILISAHNEEKVIGKLLKKMTSLSYPKNKLGYCDR